MVPGRLGLAVVDLAAITTAQPARARDRAIVRPIPREAPVITATREESGWSAWREEGIFRGRVDGLVTDEGVDGW